MSRIAFCECGFILDGSPPSLSPLNGWFWPKAILDTSDTTGPGTQHPAFYDPITYFAFWWRLKRLKCSINITTAFYTDNFSFDIPFDTITAELQLVGTSNHHFHATGSNGGKDYIVDLGSETVVGIVTDAKPFAPNFQLFDSLGNITSLNLSAWAASSIVCTVLGELITIYVNPLAAPATGTIDITVADSGGYWEYDGVFDPDTGAQLITPAPQGL